MITLWQAEELDKLKESLQHVYWIGGGTDAGKTTTARLLAETYDVNLYLSDFDGQDHWENLLETEQPSMYKWLNMSVDDRWVNCTVDALVVITLRCMTEGMKMKVKKFINMPSDKPLLAEGYGMMPNFVAPLLSNLTQAVWMIPNETFKQESLIRRGKTQYHMDTSDPEKGWDNHLKRDLRLAELSLQQAKQHGLQYVINDGSRSTEEMARYVADVLGLSSP